MCYKAAMKSWLLDILACPIDACAGELRAHEEPSLPEGGGDGLLRCAECGALYPVLNGVPVLTPSPGQWLASYRESALAALAEHGTVSRSTVDIIDAFAEPHAGAEPLRFGDDWVSAERSGSLVLTPPAGDGPSVDAYRAFLEQAQPAGPAAAVLALLGDTIPGPVLEVGPGAGILTRSLAARAPRLVVCDLSLRSVLLSLERTAERGGPSGSVAGAVAEAEALAVHPGSIRTIVAANVVDLLDDPAAFLEGAAAALAKGGRLVVTTPDPELGMPPAGEGVTALEHAIAEAGLEVLVARDGIPWVRAHSSRRHEVYFVRAVLAKKKR
jgi:uncharacterized protein YbaR (Trm112 family)/SAM-dependent methyltransferase